MPIDMPILMGRPTTMAKGRPVKIYLPSQLAADASLVAQANPKDQSLSAMIRRLLEREMRNAARRKVAA